MAKKTSKKPPKVAKKNAAKRHAAKASKPRKAAPKSQSPKAAKPVLLSGGNPQIAKGYGDAPVQAYIAAMPGWKRDVGRRLDALIVRTRPRRAQGGQMVSDTNFSAAVSATPMQAIAGISGERPKASAMNEATGKTTEVRRSAA